MSSKKINPKFNLSYLSRKIYQFLHFSKFFIKKPIEFENVIKTKIENITILAAGRDLEMLEISLKYIEAFIDYENIFLISPFKNKVQKNLPNVTIIEDEEILYDYETEFFKKINESKSDRFFPVNWYLQQYLKLIHLNRLSLDNTFIIDSDTIPLSPPKIFHNSKIIVPYTHEYRPQYHDFLQRFVFKDLNISKKNIHIAHYCFFEMRILNLINDYFKKNGTNMFEILKNACLNDHFFSEYELYNQFLLTSFPDQSIELYYNGINLPREVKYIENIDLAGLFDYASFHYWKESKILPFY